ncbi:MAG: sulfurtransferase, partial [Gammaproteobacteria bacterium]|nr:sulfurtransferase [Gammaproteobacteria bacterium]
MHSILISSSELSAHLDDPDWIVVDCRYDLTDPQAGRAAYLEGHIPGAVYAHLDDDLSSAPVTDNGRHPLPAPDDMAERFGAMGIGNGCQVVVYDAMGGAMAGRLWWMLRY